MKLGRLLIAFCLLNSLFFTKLYAQQNIQFSQYIFNSLSVNPAYAGYKEEWFAQVALRAQWVGMEGAPRTASASIDGIVDPLNRKNGIGIQVTSDKVGPQSTNSATFNYAYRLPLDQDEVRRLCFGVGVGFAQHSLNGQILTTFDPDDTSLPVNNISSFSPDIRMGVYYSSDYFYAGASLMDALSGSTFSNSESLNIVRGRHAYFITGGLINVSSQFRLRGSLLVKDDFKGPTSTDINVMAILNDKIWLGGSFRTGFNVWKKQDQNFTGSKRNSISGIVQFYINEKLRIGYSYDYVTSKLGSGQIGTQEISLGLSFGQVSKAYICPKVF